MLYIVPLDGNHDVQITQYEATSHMGVIIDIQDAP